MQVSEQSLNSDGFKAGRIKQFYEKWKKLTSDSVILNMVKGARIPLENLPDESENDRKNQIQ